MHSLYKTAGKCTLNRNKVRYPNQKEAQLALAVIKGRGNPKHTEKRAYHCPVCHGWHLTSAETVNDTVLSGSVLQHTNPNAFNTGMEAFKSGSRQGRYSISKASLTRRVRHLLHLFAANDIPEDSWDNPWLWATLRFQIMWHGGDEKAEQLLSTSKKTVKMAGDMLAEDKEPFLRVAETRKEAQKLQNTPLPAWLAVALMADKGKEQKV